MKRTFFIITLFVIALHAEEPHTFTASDGRTLKATVVSKTDTHVTIRRAEDGQEFQLPLERLSAADQAFVKGCKPAADQAAATSQAPVKWKKTWVVEPKWDGIRAPMDGVAAVRLGGKWGFVSETGKLVAEAKWEDVGNFVEGMAAVKAGGKWGFIDKEGKVVVEPSWDEAGRFEEGLAPVKRGTLWGYIDKTGKVVIEPSWETAFSFTEGMACIGKGGMHGFIDTTGKVVIEPTWKLPGRFSHGVVVMKTANRDGKVAVLNKQGATLYEKSFGHEPGTPVEVTEHGIIAHENFWNHDPKVVAQPKARLMSFDGRVIHEQPVRAKIEFHEGLAAVWLQDNQLTFIDHTGARAFKTIFVAPEYKMTAHGETPQYRFSEGLVAAPGRDPEKKHKLRYLDKNGTVVIPARWGFAGPFSEGVALVSEMEKYNPKASWQIINRQGVVQAEVKLPTGAKLPVYHLQWSQGFRNGRVVFQQECSTTSRGRFERSGFIGTDGEVAIPAAFNEESVLSHFQKGLAVITPAKLRSYSDFTDQAVIDTSGELVASPVRGDTQRMTFPDYAAKTDGPIVCGASPRRYGLLNAAGKIVAAAAWEDAEILSPDLIAIKKNGKFGLVNGKGDVVLPTTLTGIDFVDVLSTTHIWVRKDGQTGSLSIRSGEFTPHEKPDYQMPVVDHSSDAFTLFQDPQTKLHGIKAKDGTVTLPPKYPFAHRASGKRFWVSNRAGGNTEYALITETGQTLTEFEWWHPSKRQMRDGLMLVMKEFDGDSGYMDENGKLIIPLSPGRKSDFAHGAAMVWKDGQSGLINPKGEWIFQSSAEVELAEIGYTSDFADYFQHGLALVELPMKWGLMSLEKVSP